MMTDMNYIDTLDSGVKERKQAKNGDLNGLKICNDIITKPYDQSFLYSSLVL